MSISISSWESIVDLVSRYYTRDLSPYYTNNHVRLVCTLLLHLMKLKELNYVCTYITLCEPIIYNKGTIYISVPLLATLVNKPVDLPPNNIEFVNGGIDLFDEPLKEQQRQSSNRHRLNRRKRKKFKGDHNDIFTDALDCKRFKSEDDKDDNDNDDEEKDGRIRYNNKDNYYYDPGTQKIEYDMGYNTLNSRKGRQNFDTLNVEDMVRFQQILRIIGAVIHFVQHYNKQNASNVFTSHENFDNVYIEKASKESFIGCGKSIRMRS